MESGSDEENVCEGFVEQLPLEDYLKTTRSSLLKNVIEFGNLKQAIKL